MGAVALPAKAETVESKAMMVALDFMIRDGVDFVLFD
jgi:hypothetical protein